MTDTTSKRPTETRAAGVRATYEQLPTAVQRWVERELAASVVSATTQSGGFSPGAAARLVAANGRRAFVKAVGTPLNPQSPDLFRQEEAAMRALPELDCVPRLLAAYDDGDWVALLLEDIDGRMPDHPWTAADVDVVFAALAELSTALTPSPWPDAPPLEDRGLFTEGWATLMREPYADLDPWASARLPALAALTERARAAVPGDTLTHWDIRADNVLIASTDQVVFVDWTWACHAAPWVDTALAALDLVISGSDVDVDALLARHPATSDADPDDVTALVGAVTGMITERSRRPAPPGLPTIRDYQRMVSGALIGWLKRRM